MRKYTLQITVLSGIVALGVLTFLFWVQLKKRFPFPHQDGYAGYLTHATAAGETLPFTLMRVSSSQHQLGDLYVSVFRKDWPSELVDPKVLEPEAWIAPLKLEQEDQILQFIGNAVADGTLSGTVEEIQSGRKGTWKLSPLPLHERLYDRKVEQALTLWSGLADELQGVEEELQQARTEAPKMKEEIEELSQLLSDKSTLREEGDKKMRLAEERKDAAVANKKAARKQLDEAQRRYELAFRVGPVGSLVTLEREILNLEHEWIEKKLEMIQMGVSQDFQKEVERAREILKLQELIALEKERLQS